MKTVEEVQEVFDVFQVAYEKAKGSDNLGSQLSLALSALGWVLGRAEGTIVFEGLIGMCRALSLEDPLEAMLAVVQALKDASAKAKALDEKEAANA